MERQQAEAQGQQGQQAKEDLSNALDLQSVHLPNLTVCHWHLYHEY